MSYAPSNWQIEELHESLPIGSGSTRSRLISTINVLAALTDEEEGLTATEIARCIGYGTASGPSENAILGDLHAIAQGKPLGMNVTVPHKGDNAGFRCSGRPLTSDEVAVLDNLVQACMFIAPAQRKTLRSKLRGLAPRAKTTDVLDAVYVDERDSSGVYDIFRTLGIVSQAIRDNEKISFHIASHLMNGNEVQGELLEESPIAIVFSFGRYYVQTLRAGSTEGAMTRFRRLDRMRNVMACGKPVDDLDEVKRLRAAVSAEVSERVDMLGDGPTRLLALKVQGPYAKYVYDRFGHDVRFFDVDESSATGFACIQVRLSQTLYRWLIGMCEGIALMKPTARIQAHILGTGLAHMPEQGVEELSTRLLNDYRAARDGIARLIRAAERLYEEE